jgi:sterol 14alpha-demethylase
VHFNSVSPAVSHRLPTVYKNPEEFDPDRYFAPRCEDAPKFSFIAFGGGRHSCLGEHFGVLQVKTIWSILIREFNLSLPDPSLAKIPLQADYSTLVAGPKPPSMLRLTPIKIDPPASA